MEIKQDWNINFGCILVPIKQTLILISDTFNDN